jgi:glycosyltransferase involved in cell wall biosynthesis
MLALLSISFEVGEDMDCLTVQDIKLILELTLPRKHYHQKDLIKFIGQIIIKSLLGTQIFVTRSPRPAYIPTFFRKVLKHKIIVYMGCTPLKYYEKMSFWRNKEFRQNSKKINRILAYFEFILEKYVLRNADYFLIENKKAEFIIKRFGCDVSKIILLRYYVQDYFLQGSNPEYKNNSPFLIGYTGRFNPYDNLSVIIDSIQILKKKNLNIILYLIGDGPIKKKIENKVIRLNLGQNIIFLGSQTHENVSKLIDNYHCLILPMVNSICPSTVAIKILEGVLKGKIIITNNAGYNKQFFNPYYDLILETLSPRILAQKIELILQNYRLYLDRAQIIRDNQIKIHNKANYNSVINNVINRVIN